MADPTDPTRTGHLPDHAACQVSNINTAQAASDTEAAANAVLIAAIVALKRDTAEEEHAEAITESAAAMAGQKPLAEGSDNESAAKHGQLKAALALSQYVAVNNAAVASAAVTSRGGSDVAAQASELIQNAGAAIQQAGGSKQSSYTELVQFINAKNGVMVQAANAEAEAIRQQVTNMLPSTPFSVDTSLPPSILSLSLSLKHALSLALPQNGAVQAGNVPGIMQIEAALAKIGEDRAKSTKETNAGLKKLHTALAASEEEITTAAKSSAVADAVAKFVGATSTAANQLRAAKASHLSHDIAAAGQAYTAALAGYAASTQRQVTGLTTKLSAMADSRQAMSHAMSADPGSSGNNAMAKVFTPR